MKKILALMLVLLMLASCGCSVAPAEEGEDEYVAELEENRELVNLAASE